MGDLSLECWVYGEDPSRTFFVDISTTQRVAGLKKAIKNEKPVSFQSVDPDALDLYHFSPSGGDTLDQQLKKWSLVGQTCLDTGAKLSGLGLTKDSVIIITVPSAGVCSLCHATSLLTKDIP